MKTEESGKNKRRFCMKSKNISKTHKHVFCFLDATAEIIMHHQKKFALK